MASSAINIASVRIVSPSAVVFDSHAIISERGGLL